MRAATCGSPTTWAAASGRSWPPPTTRRPRPRRPCSARRRPWRWTGRSSISPGITRPRGRRTSRTPTRSWPRSTAGTPTASRCRPTPSSSPTAPPPAAAGSTAASAPTGSTRRPAASPAASRTGSRTEWGWAWPANRRVLYNRASADPDGKPWSERKALVWWDEENGKWTGHDIPDFIADRPPSYRPPAGRHRSGRDRAATTRSSCRPTARRWLFAPAGLVDGPMPAHYEPQESPLPNLLYGQQHNPVRQIITDPAGPLPAQRRRARVGRCSRT